MEIFLEKKADATKLSDVNKKMDEFFKGDDSRYIVLFDMISESDRFQCEILEALLLKTKENIKENMLTLGCYSQNELDVVNFFLEFLDVHFIYGLKDDVDFSPTKQPDGFGVVNI